MENLKKVLKEVKKKLAKIKVYFSRGETLKGGWCQNSRSTGGLVSFSFLYSHLSLSYFWYPSISFSFNFGLSKRKTK